MLVLKEVRLEVGWDVYIHHRNTDRQQIMFREVTDTDN